MRCVFLLGHSLLTTIQTDVSSLAAIRVIRLLRVFRAFKVGKYSSEAAVCILLSTTTGLTEQSS